MINKDDVFIGNILLKSIKYFLDNPYTEIYLREFSRKLEISPNTAQRFLELFLMEGLLKEVRLGNLRFFKANLDSLVFRHLKIVFSLRKIENAGLLKEFRDNGVSYCVLFGSVAKGEDDQNSDIDLVVIGNNKKKIFEIVREREKIINKEINVHFFTWIDWKKQMNKNKAFYQDVINDGVALIGKKPVTE